MSEYVYVWEYRVRPERLEEFLELYGEGGGWVRLFQRGAGYLGTRLLRDRRDPLRFLTVDRWSSPEAFRAFRQELASEFEKLDRRGEELTEEERELGTFDGSGGAGEPSAPV